MENIVNFFKNITSLKLILIALPFGILSVFIEKKFPSLFLGCRLIVFGLVIYAIIKLFSSKK